MKERSIKQKMGKFYIFLPVALITALLIFVRFWVLEYNLDFITLNSLASTVVASSIFIIGFLLSGVFTDYKESDKIPSEIRAILESIIYEGDSLFRKDASFSENNKKIKETVVRFINEFEAGLRHDKNHSHIEQTLIEIQNLDTIFDDMEERGVPPNYMTRIKTEQSNLRKILLRVYHIQKTKFIPSVVILVEAIVVAVVFLLIFVETDKYIGYLELGVISFILIYVRSLIIVLEKPFRKGLDDTSDDVSIFVLRELRHELEKNLI